MKKGICRTVDSDSRPAAWAMAELQGFAQALTEAAVVGKQHEWLAVTNVELEMGHPGRDEVLEGLYV